MPNDPPSQPRETADKPFPPLALLAALTQALRRATLTTGEAAALRRLDPARPDRRHILPLMRLLVEAGIEDLPPADGRHDRLALIANAIALARGAHDPRRPAGEALHALGLSEQRLMALLAADFATLTDLLPRIARRAAAAREAMDWQPLVLLAWFAEHDEARADEQRRRIASRWLRAAAQQQPNAA
jgi:hypothetical protein